MQGRGEWGEGNHHMVRGKDLERKKAYCLYCGKPVSELAVRLKVAGSEKQGGSGVWLLLEKGTSFLFVKLN